MKIKSSHHARETSKLKKIFIENFKKLISDFGVNFTITGEVASNIHIWKKKDVCQIMKNNLSHHARETSKIKNVL